ncbi:SDR family NAD(P)-dependent oxidoreductase [Hymenobacter taeanensis]|uniref:SDR family NAD(P)-dependent oxidoreductase n=1 Tax=Hymenobacter taeanensis TaxID=2735321 RepID=A0A6M6BN75_9BACT|nr:MULTISPECIES: SDR family oxidoreductase [Hymenobacter]QJX48953.1 SDR family NAD(P)-dependent oxidoreductase [Hymenobacter taeanensis]UOQ81534.1 SDR family oxidoreductase [Hymenobacter sp. 5414T-23]
MKSQTRNTLLATAAGALLAATLYSNRRGNYSLAGRVVLITGGSRGLGLILARQAVAEGARVAICARDAEELERARLELTQDGGQVLALVRNLTDANDVHTLVREVREQLGSIDVLVNNAGIITAGPLDHIELRDYEDSMDTHFWAPLHAMQAVLPDMRRRGEGRIVNIASVGGKVAVPHLAPYCASKFALVGLSEAYRAELKQYGVLVTTVCPGLMRTGSARNAIVKGQHKKEYASFIIADSLPGLSMNADSAGRQIWNACRRGEAEVILSLPAKLLSGFHGLFPGTTADVLSWVNRTLPGPTNRTGDQRRFGHESESEVSRSWLTALTRKAEKQNNER